jgi:hypothetical protein
VNRRIWPHDADHQVTVRATGEQLWDWKRAASLLGLTHTGQFLSYAGDVTAEDVRKQFARAARREAKERAKREAEGGA